ncbi:MAG: hypothetical protein KGI70_02380 [Patescibacteria group bacterium]|nr:hypothetical protein [Patescibacteria group bacterium]
MQDPLNIAPSRAKKSRDGQSLNLYKRLGETPRERLERLRVQKYEYENEVLSYAGRLDPMAEGVLLALVGPANKERDKYLDLDKEYVLDILFGFSTNTYDVLGKVLARGDASHIERVQVRQALNEFRGDVSQEYPPYSSKTVDGRSLFEWARSGAIGSLVLPSRSVKVYSINLVDMYKVPEPQLLHYISESVGLVQGDFRQEEIIRLWERELRTGGMREFPAATVKVECSSGTYMRSIANDLGRHLGVPALALHITRTRVGDFLIDKSLK